MSSLSENRPPEGGWGWMVVFAAFVVYFIVFGSLRCQSVLFVPIMNEFESDYFSVGWVSATATAGLALSGILSAFMMSKLGHRVTIMIGGLLACLTSIASMLAPSVAVLNLTAGLLTGIGLGISFVAAPVMVGLYFKKKRAFATNLASMGASIGAFALCPLNGIIVKIYNLRGYYLILSGIFLQLSVAGALMRPITTAMVEDKPKSTIKCKRNVEDADSQEKVSTSLVAAESIEGVDDEEQFQQQKPLVALSKNLPFLVYCLSQMVFLAGFLTSQLYIVPFAERELSISRLKAPLIMSISAGTELLSRIVFGILGDMRINRLLMFACDLLLLSISTLAIPLSTSFETLSVAAAVTGLFQGGFSGISIVVLADIVGIQLYGTALGISTLLNGVGTLLAPPLIGIAVNNSKKPSIAIYISAGFLFLGAMLTFLIEVVVRKQRKSARNVES